jgi:uncharacterized repeat protein (TIGR01451 family)
MVIGLVVAVAIGLVGAPAALAKEDMTIWGYGVRQPIYRGETTQLKFVVKNNGPGRATGVWVQAVVPAGLHIRGTKLYGGRSCFVKGTFVKCQMGDFANQQMGTLLIDVRGDLVGTWITEADVYSTDGKDSSGGNGQVRATIMVKPRDSASSTPQVPWPDGSYGPPSPGLTLAERIRASFDKLQHVVRDGGLRITLRVPRNGALLVGGKIRVPGGFVHLGHVTRERATKDRAWPIWLAATPEDLTLLRRVLRAGGTRPARIWVHYKDETIRYDLAVTR